MATTNTFANVKRDSTFWLYDGNIVLIARSNEPVAFRVHESVLALHSEFFAGMFQRSLSPADGHDDERFEGCSVVPLDDAAYDVEQLLRVIYGINRLKTPEETTFPILAALVRVGHKYAVTGVHDVVNECSHQLLSMFSPSYAPEALHVFRLVDLGTDDPCTLSFILFLCAQLDENELSSGTTRSDGTRETLSDGDLTRVLTLKRELQRRAEQVVSDAEYDFAGPQESCERYDEDGNMVDSGLLECDFGYDEFVAGCIPQRVRDVYGRGDPFYPWLLDRMRDARRWDRVCFPCLKPKLSKQIQLREEAWDALPVLAGLVE